MMSLYLFKILSRNQLNDVFQPKHKMKIKNKLPFITFVLVLILGSFLQILSICELFFSYPTVILSETTFDVFAIPFPSMTFCAYVGNKTNRMTSEEDFDTFNVSEIVESIQYYDGESGHTLNIFHQVKFHRSLSRDCICYTIKPDEHGKLQFNCM